MKAQPSSLRLLFLAGTALLVLTEKDVLSATGTSLKFKPVSDETWRAIAGKTNVEKYTVVPGDTLSSISQKLFGDAKSWPKLWALNHPTIANPNWIKPGATILFSSGTGNSLPSLELTQAPVQSDKIKTSSAAAEDEPKAKRRSDEWKRLNRQDWETVSVALPAEVDAQGFDRRNKVRFRNTNGFELPALAATQEIEPLGKIIGSRSEGAYLTVEDIVYIQSDGNLNIGETYALTNEPTVLKSDSSDREGYSYLMAGKVKILSVKDGLFVGKILTNRELVSRGTFLMKMPPRANMVDPVGAGAAVEGRLMLDMSNSTTTTAQHKQVFIDRGSQDGVSVGNVFRVYQHHDPSNERKITESDFIVTADILVVQVTEQFSSGIVIRSLIPVQQDSRVVLLTDVSDLRSRNRGRKSSVSDVEEGVQLKTAPKKEIDELDLLDSGGDLGKDEERELKQLENWKGNAAPGTPKPISDPAPQTQPAEPAPPPPPPPASGDEISADDLKALEGGDAAPPADAPAPEVQPVSDEQPAPSEAPPPADASELDALDSTF